MLNFLFNDDRHSFYTPSFHSGPRTSTPPPSQDISLIDARLSSLELACASLWELLKTKHGYTDSELTTLIHEVDSRDGKVDGKITKAPSQCANCKRPMLTRNANRCLWCGADCHTAPI